MTVAPGTRLGPYEIAAPLGAGGMGEVWKARDARLDRWVAIKVLPPRATSSEEARRRFEREAKTIARLSHPHICAVYDAGREGETEYLVMEYLEGETLADRLTSGPLPLAETLRFGMEIADALEKAHRAGVVHRDLKPGNVMLTKGGVKLLDFGLARVLEPSSSPAGSLSELPTQAKPLTVEGTILGTVQYMAPEQLQGKESDARTDVFALGAVLYEMASGRRAFAGGSPASIMADILHTEPPPLSSVRALPPELDRVVRTCLAKDPDARWQSAADVGRQLAWIGEGTPVTAGAPRAAAPARLLRERAAWMVAVLALAGVAWMAWKSGRSRPPGELTRLMILPPAGDVFFGQAAISPDGRRILFLLLNDAGRTSIGLRSLDALEMRRLPGTEEARGMFWSPDGREIAFFSEQRLKRMSADGGPVQTVCEAAGAFSGSWGKDGTILFMSQYGGPILAVPASGGTPKPVTAPDAAHGEFACMNPAFLPDGRHFVFAVAHRDPDKDSVVLGSLDSKEVLPLFAADSSAFFAEPGYLVFGRNGAIFAWKFDPRALRLSGEPVPLFDNARVLRDDQSLSASAAGSRLVYLTWAGRRRLVWVDRTGRELSTLGELGGYSDVRISPDGKRVAAASHDPEHGQNQDLWVFDVGRNTSSRIASSPNEEFNPAWLRDGERLVYIIDRLGFYDVFEKPVEGGPEKPLIVTKQDKTLPDVSPDGRSILVTVREGANYVRVLMPIGGGPPVRLGNSPGRFSEQHASFSPDGRWTAFDSEQSGDREVYVEPLEGGPARQVSIGGGQLPVWNRNGSELFYAARSGILMSVALRFDGRGVEIGEPRPLFLLGLGTSGELMWHRHPYDVTPDGQRFLVIRPALDAGPPAAVLATNWTAAMKGAR